MRNKFKITGSSIFFFAALFLPNVFFAQKVSQKSVTSAFLDFGCTEAEACDLIIHNGLFDWASNTAHSGGQALPGGNNAEHLLGAVTVVNNNDTNGNNIIDKAEVTVASTNNGSNEIDLMKLVVKKPDPDVGGDVKITIVSGNIKLWESPLKITEIVPVEGKILFPVAQLDKTIYVEATEVSTALRDIVIKMEYNNRQDVVKATGMWVENTTMPGHWAERTEHPIPGVDLPNVGVLITQQVNGNKAADNSRYGHGECRAQIISEVNQDIEIGGRILMEWQVLPSGADNLVSFDVTRQRKTFTSHLDYGSLNFIDSDENREFPGVENDDYPENDMLPADLPNDDGDGGLEDRIPINGLLYSWDNPSILKDYSEWSARAFHVSKNWFKEFVRIRVKANPFTNTDSTLQGSRCSDKFDWHCVYYTRRDENYKLTSDENLVSYSYLKSDQIEVDDYLTFECDVSGIPDEVRAYNIIYMGIVEGQKKIKITYSNGTVTEFEFFYIEADSDTWNINFDGLGLTINELADIPTNTTFVFNTFRTNAGVKDNKTNEGTYVNFIR